jgi:hypothetical protein
MVLHTPGSRRWYLNFHVAEIAPPEAFDNERIDPVGITKELQA